jgi:hypothetical protein
MNIRQELTRAYFENLTMLGRHAHMIGDHKTAKLRYRQAKIAVKRIEDNRLSVALLAVNTARLYRDCRQFKRAELIYKRALTIFLELKRCSDSIIVFLELSELALLQNRIRAARFAYREALQMTVKMRPELDEVVRVACRLAHRYNQKDYVDDAMALTRFVDHLRYSQPAQ